MPTWRIHRIVSTCKAIDALLQETRREAKMSPNAASTVTLRADAPAGRFRDEIRPLSNDPTTRLAIADLGDDPRRSDRLSEPALARAGQLLGRSLRQDPRPGFSAFQGPGVEGEGAGFKIQADHEEARNGSPPDRHLSPGKPAEPSVTSVGRFGSIPIFPTNLPSN